MAIKTNNLTKTFGGNRAVDDLTLEIPARKITGLIGPNGSGKTTLINLLTGMESIDSGSVVVSDTTLERIRSQDTPTYGMTRTFQQVRLFLQMPVLDNLLVVLTERGVFSALFEQHKEFHRQQAEDILKTVDLWEKRDESVENLSYGQRKLLEIGRAMAMDANIIFLDEPFAGLFPEMVDTVSTVVRKLREQGKTVVLIEHDMEIIKDLCDEVIVLDAGGKLTTGTPDTVLAKQEVKDAYLGT